MALRMASVVSLCAFMLVVLGGWSAGLTWERMLWRGIKAMVVFFALGLMFGSLGIAVCEHGKEKQKEEMRQQFVNKKDEAMQKAGGQITEERATSKG